MRNNNIRVIGLKAGERMLALAHSIIDTNRPKIVFSENVIHPHVDKHNTYFCDLSKVISIIVDIGHYPDITEIIFMRPSDNTIDKIEGVAKAFPNITFYIFTQLNESGRYRNRVMELINKNLDNKTMPIGVGDVVQINGIDKRAIVISVADLSSEDGSVANIMLDGGCVISMNTNRMTRMGYSRAFVDALSSLKEE